MKNISEFTFKDLLMGLAIGDAYGAGLEYVDRNWIWKHLDFNRIYNERNDIPQVIGPDGLVIQGYHAWEYTEDTNNHFLAPILCL